jgi:hypothetical protein
MEDDLKKTEMEDDLKKINGRRPQKKKKKKLTKNVEDEPKKNGIRPYIFFKMEDDLKKKI